MFGVDKVFGWLADRLVITGALLSAFCISDCGSAVAFVVMLVAFWLVAFSTAVVLAVVCLAGSGTGSEQANSAKIALR